VPRSLPGFQSQISFYRLLDAAANRGREAIRVLEDYVRFVLDDSDLTQRFKTFRHQFQNVLQQFPMESRLAARNTESDVGTDISAEGEYDRPTVDNLLSANFSRLQESLRSLEEFSKMVDPQAAKQFEQLRYLCYTLHKETAEGRGQTVAERGSVATAQTPLESAVLYALVDVRSDEAAFEQFVTDITAGGVDIIQLRDKQADDRTLLARSRILQNCISASGRNVLFIMNDRPDLALLAGADGVHVGQEELPAALVRQLVGTLLVGVSTHSIEQARQAILDGADYIGVGPVFESTTKEFSQLLPGLDFLHEIAEEILIPAFAIGGITEDRLDSILQAGISRVAVCSALLETENPREVAEWLSGKLKHGLPSVSRVEQ
jgi:thiamine-phosphate pyrophosphorylase